MTAPRLSPIGPGPHRELGEEMIADGWVVVGGDDIYWLNPPSKRSVCIDAIKRGNAIMPGLTEADETAPDDREGFCVLCRRHDEHGNPEEGDCFWTESFAEAVRRARAIRRSILAEKPKVDASVQMTLDDVLEKGGGS